jgi:hypothetical protein
MIIAIINTQWIIFAKLCSIALYSVTGGSGLNYYCIGGGWGLYEGK